MVNGSQEHSSRWWLAGKSAKITRWKTVSPETVCAAVRQAFTKSANIPPVVADQFLTCLSFTIWSYSLLILESRHNDACIIFFCFILPLERRENGTKRKICLLESRLLAFGFSPFTLADRWLLLHFFSSLNIGFQGQSQAMCLLRSLLSHTWYCNYPILFWDSRISKCISHLKYFSIKSSNHWNFCLEFYFSAINFMLLLHYVIVLLWIIM